MKLRSLILVLVFAVALAAPAAAASWTNDCEDNATAGKPSYCQNVGKDAYNSFGGPRPRLGKVVGVTFRPKGSPIGVPNQTSERDAYYYIIDSEYGIFIRMCSEIECR